MITVNVAVLKALLNTAGDRDIRYYLNGVKVEATRTGSRLVSTDGHMCGIYRDTKMTNPDIPEGEVVEFIVPRDVVKAIKVNPAQPYAVLKAGPAKSDGSRELVIDYSGMAVTTRSIDGVFPDYRRIVPHEFTGESAQFNQALTARISKLFKEARPKGKGGFSLAYNGQGGALARDDRDDLLVVLMPLRKEHDTAADPRMFSWARQSILPVPAKIAA